MCGIVTHLCCLSASYDLIIYPNILLYYTIVVQQQVLKSLFTVVFSYAAYEMVVVSLDDDILQSANRDGSINVH
jgi:hypothetical protein